MRVVDTSAWIEWLMKTPIGKATGLTRFDRALWLVPTIVQLELAKWVKREMGEIMADDVLAFSQKCVVIPLTTEIAVSAAALSSAHKLATADAIVYATARAHGADVLTCDAHFKNLPNVTFIEKRA
jgi:predicted nucleic acid-binding protein